MGIDWGEDCLAGDKRSNRKLRVLRCSKSIRYYYVYYISRSYNNLPTSRSSARHSKGDGGSFFGCLLYDAGECYIQNKVVSMHAPWVPIRLYRIDSRRSGALIDIVCVILPINGELFAKEYGGMRDMLI